MVQGSDKQTTRTEGRIMIAEHRACLSGHGLCRGGVLLFRANWRCNRHFFPSLFPECSLDCFQGWVMGTASLGPDKSRDTKMIQGGIWNRLFLKVCHFSEKNPPGKKKRKENVLDMTPSLVVCELCICCLFSGRDLYLLWSQSRDLPRSTLYSLAALALHSEDDARFQNKDQRNTYWCIVQWGEVTHVINILSVVYGSSAE